MSLFKKINKKAIQVNQQYTEKRTKNSQLKNPREEYINYIKGIINNTLSKDELNKIIDPNINKNIKKNTLKTMLNPTIFKTILTKFVKEKLSKNIKSEIIENDIYNKIRTIDKSKKPTNENINIAENRIKILLNPEIQKKFIEEYRNTIVINSNNIFNILKKEATNSYKNKEFILNNNFDLNLPNEKDGNTLLMFAIINNHTKIAELLIKKGCKLDLQDKYGVTALMYSIHYAKTDIAELLIKKGCKLDLQDIKDDTALMLSIRNNQIDIAKLLIKRGCNLNLQNKRDRYTALMLAIINNQIDIVNLLIVMGCYLDLQNIYGYTALIYSINYAKTDIVTLLIEKGCKLDLQDKDGNTALMYATKCNNIEIEIAKLLIKSGCKLDIHDKNGNTVLEILEIKIYKEPKEKIILGITFLEIIDYIYFNINKIPNINSVIDINTLYNFIKFKLIINNKFYEKEYPNVLNKFFKNKVSKKILTVTLGNELNTLVNYFITNDINYSDELMIIFDGQKGSNAGGLNRQFFNSIDAQLIFHFIKKNFNKKLSDFKQRLSDFNQRLSAFNKRTVLSKKATLKSDFNRLLEEYSKINLEYKKKNINNFNDIDLYEFDEKYLKEDISISLETLIKILALSAYNGNPIIYNEIFDGNKYEIIIDNIIKEFGIKNKLKKLITQFYLHNITEMEKKHVNIESIKSISNNYSLSNNEFIKSYNKNSNQMQNQNNNEFIQLINQYYNNSPYDFYILHMIDFIISKEKLMEKLIFRFDGMSNSNSTNFKNKMINDIFQKFTDKDIEKFNFAISGSKKMCPKYNINVVVTDKIGIEFHTCFFKMDIFLDKESINETYIFDTIRESILKNNNQFNSV